jgi:predicted acetylornithine/succinylornithine family transaminase
MSYKYVATRCTELVPVRREKQGDTMSVTTVETPKNSVAPAPAAATQTGTVESENPHATSDVAQSAGAQTGQSSDEKSSANATALQLIETDARVGIQNYGRLPLAFARGEGARLWDAAGKEYLDFLGGIAVVTLGHSHPAVTEAVSRQAATLLHSSNIYYIEPQVQLAEKLHQLSGGMRAFFCNSGAEANEAAIKIARKYMSTRGESRREIITTFDSFHGRTYASLAATGQPKYHEGFEPMPGGFNYVPRNDFEALKNAVTENTAAILLEPIQGESGIWMCDDQYLQQVRALCDEHNILLMFDEVQCGIGRTGKFFAWEHAGVQPDIMTLAKGLGNGIPIGAMLARDEVAKAFVPGTHGCTFGGNFLSTTAALATIRVLEEQNLMENAVHVGDYFQMRLREWGEKTGIVTEVRGRGLMIGASVKNDIARDLMKSALEQGLVFNAVGTDILRFLPPLCITQADVEEAMDKLAAAFDSLQK